MKFNHYYKELGLKETDFPFEKSEDICDRNVENEEGFSEIEFFSLDYSLALYIYSRLRYFQDNCLVGCPMGMEFNKWEKIIQKMIKGFKLYLIDESQIIDLSKSTKEWQRLSKNKQKQIKYGMRLFIKYFGHLWY